MGVVEVIEEAGPAALHVRRAIGPDQRALVIVHDVDVVVVLLAHGEQAPVRREVHVLVAAVGGQIRRGELPDDPSVHGHLDQPVVAPVGDDDGIRQRLAPRWHG